MVAGPEQKPRISQRKPVRLPNATFGSLTPNTPVFITEGGAAEARFPRAAHRLAVVHELGTRFKAHANVSQVQARANPGIEPCLVGVAIEERRVEGGDRF